MNCIPQLSHVIRALFASWFLFTSAVAWCNTSGTTALLPPTNDNCASAEAIMISNGGFDYGLFTSGVADMSTATAQAGEYFAFASNYNHSKSIWYTFTLATNRSVTIEIAAATGSVIPSPESAGITVYSTNANCLPGTSDNPSSLISSGKVTNSCLEAGTYLIQVSGISNITASVFVNLTLGCPDNPIDSPYDCPANAYLFNGGAPLPMQSVTGVHKIVCHSIEAPNEFACLPMADRADYIKSAWYVFTTGNIVDLVAFDFFTPANGDRVGYRIFEGNVRNQSPDALAQLDCGMAKQNGRQRFVELPCLLAPNTTYSMALLFHKDYSDENMNMVARQRGVGPTGWPRPVLAPVNPANQLGTLLGTPGGALNVYDDQFDCSAFLIDNACPPANPASGLAIVGSKTYDMATWVTFTLATDANVTFNYSASNTTASYHTRIYHGTINAACPSPGPADLYFEFPGRNNSVKCMPAGDYAMQVLSSSIDANAPAANYLDAWQYGTLGTTFTFHFNVVSLPANGLFRLDVPGAIDSINNLNPLQNNVTYNAKPAVFVCVNTVLPDNTLCEPKPKAMYREVNIQDANGDGIPDEGLLTIGRLRTDIAQNPPIHYSIYQGDANALATGASTHDEGEVIAGLTDHLGFCIENDDATMNPPGIDNFCTCVEPGPYTLVGFGNVDNVAKGDNPFFRFSVLETTHHDRPNAEYIDVQGPGNYVSGTDVFSCTDNIGNLPPCGDRRKVVYREFFLAEESVVVISEIGNGSSLLSLFTGRASDLGETLVLHTDCFSQFEFIDLCTPLQPGWYTVVSYGAGPNNTTQRTWDAIGSRRDVGSITQVQISLIPPVIPNYNRPYKAHQGGITDWADPLAGNPNVVTGRLYNFLRDTFCDPDTPFIPTQLLPCGAGYNRVAFYVFEITKPSFVHIRNIDVTYYTEVFPFDVNEDSAALLTVPPVYPCVRINSAYRQFCDLPPGKYTIAIFANDMHKGSWISPSIYVDEAAESRFDHVWNSYDFDVIPINNVLVKGRAFDTHPTLPGQSPSRDVFYCTTGATADDPTETQCGTQLNNLIYAQPAGVTKPLFLNGNPAPPLDQPWRNLWYTFMLTGSGTCTIENFVLAGISDDKPLIAVYESDADANIPWSTLQTVLDDPNNAILNGLQLIKEQVNPMCDSDIGNLVFTKSGCIRDSVRYYIVVSFDADFEPNYPNQAIEVGIRYDGVPYFPALYDERPSANVINGLGEINPPYTTVPIMPGNTFSSADFSLVCYTRNATDPSGCTGASGKSAWFRFDVGKAGQLNLALEKVGQNDWYYNLTDVTVWKDPFPNTLLIDKLTMKIDLTSGPHPWQISCIEEGSYYVLVRHCVAIDTLEHYRVVMAVTDSPGDFCTNAIPVQVDNAIPQTGATLVNCHTIGTDNGEFQPVGNACFTLKDRKSTWYKATINAGPLVDVNFTLAEDFDNTTTLNELSYRILAGSCGAMTPIACSATGSNVLTLNCLGPGDYYVQVSVPELTNNSSVNGELALTVTATPSDPQNCTEPFDPNEVLADFTYVSDCQFVSFFNNSTGGADIEYLWEFPNGTSTEAHPVWTPPVGTATYAVTLTVTNTVTSTTATLTIMVDVNSALSDYTSMSDTLICNSGTVTLDATYPGATYVWDNNSTNALRPITVAGTYWVEVTKDGCEIIDSVDVEIINTRRTINEVLCPEESLTVEGTVFDIANPTGTVIKPQAHPSGCDSLITVNLAFHDIDTTKMTSTICDGEIIVFEGQQLTQSGLYTATQTASTGCDSIVTMALTVTPMEIIAHDISGCTGLSLELAPDIDGASYAWENGPTSSTLVVSTPGTYVISVSDINDCIISEETFTVAFGELSIPDVVIPDFVCKESDITVSASGSTGLFQWFDQAIGGNAIGTQAELFIQNVINDTTVYVEAIQIFEDDTCISERVPVAIALTVQPVEVNSIDTIVCEGVKLLLPWGEQVLVNSDTSFTNSWTYAVSGCDSAQLTVNAIIQNAFLQVTIDSLQTLHIGDSLWLSPQLSFLHDSVVWLPSVGLSCDTCLNTWAKPSFTTTYDLLVWSEEGCLVTAYVKIELSRDIRIYIPNVFTPNGDNINDLFTVYAKQEVAKINRLLIFSRWGELIWQGTDFLPNGSVGWNGTFHEQPMSPGVFAWMCEIELIDGTKEVLSGDVTLIR
jgi:gliding motility-associated-like protein